MVISPYRDQDPTDPRRSGCLISAAVATGVIGVGLLLLIPAVNAAREAARRSQFT